MQNLRGKLTRIFFTGVALILMTLGRASAAPIYNPATGHWYDIVSSGASGAWDNAESNAISLGGHLVTVNDSAEEQWLRTTFGTSTRYWIGLNDAALEGTFVWSSGETPAYTHWDHDEPNNATPPDIGEDYAVLNWNPVDGAWNDWDHRQWDYGGNIAGIAEWSVSEPATLALLGVALAGLGFSRRRNCTD